MMHPENYSDFVADYYDSHADVYLDKKYQNELVFNDRIEIPAVLSLINSHFKSLKGIKVLDIGCGLGSYSKTLAKKGANVTAIDVSRKMVEITKKECAGLNVKCLCQNILDTDESEDKYDLVIAGFMLGYFQDLETYFKKFRKLLAENSIVITSSIHPAKVDYKSHNRATSDYFSSKFYASDFLDKESPLPLHRWIIEDVTVAAQSQGFATQVIAEPKPKCPPNSGSKHPKETFYMKHPSVAIYVFHRRKNGKVKKPLHKCYHYNYRNLRMPFKLFLRKLYPAR